jgi:hypothetical protein
MITPSIVMAIIVGVFWSAAYVLVRGTAGGRLPLVLLAGILGAWAGDALAGRLGFDLLVVGDVRLVGASMGSCAGIAIVALLAILGPQRGTP